VIADNRVEGFGVTESRSGNGIHLWYSRDIRIERNRVSGHRDGIYLEFAEDSELRGNVSERNLRYGLHFMFSDRCRYHRNLFRDNGAGVAVMYTRRVEMTGNRFEHNRGGAAYGMLLKEIDDSSIRGNTFLQNTVGLYAEGSNRLRVEGNVFRGNGFAVRLLASSMGGRFTGNSFTGNSFDVATNSRSSYSTFSGNYWDRYEGYDLDRDGYGDVPHHPVRLFSLMVEQTPPGLILMRSLFVDLLDRAERVFPVLTPETLVDARPRMRAAP
jgi:nitrous oxidase accessory protein